ncbi:hypothetical protein [endosymbiont 'TC1' of Trimyema compressum]
MDSIWKDVVLKDTLPSQVEFIPSSLKVNGLGS